MEILNNVFGYPHFIGRQEEIIRHVLGGGDALVIMPTGGGKSLTYQIPSMVLAGTGVVVSPLIALMQDQVGALTQMGVAAAALNSNLSLEENRATVGRFLRGELDLLYVAPERLVRPDFLDLLERARVSLFAIDEAHCVSQWGHDFRPEYAELSVLKERFPHLPRLALTATADARTRSDIADKLYFRDATLFSASFDRPNIRYRVEPKDHPLAQLVGFLGSRPSGESGIVYRMTRSNVEKTAESLQKRGFRALPYHAGLDDSVRQANQERFMREDGLIMVATVAFGMGVDKPDVRFVAHLDPPKSLEAYHQETGRAGRDGLPAEAFMTYGISDMAKLRAILGEGEEEHHRVERAKLYAMLGFCETAACRRQALLGYFGEKYPEPCGNCDNCLTPLETFDGTIHAQKALSCVFRTGQRFGAKHIADVLTGNATARVCSLGHDQIKTFGVGTELPARGWASVCRQLASAGLLALDMDGYGSLTLTPASWEVLKGEKAVKLRLDPTATKGKAKRSAKSRRIPTVLDSSEETRLFEALRAKRKELADKLGVAAYVVFHDKTLVAMVKERPACLEDMRLLHGVGQRKFDRFAEDFYEVIRDF